MIIYLNSTIAKDCLEDGRWEEGDDGQQDCHAGCDSKENDMIERSEVKISPKNRNIYEKSENEFILWVDRRRFI